MSHGMRTWLYGLTADEWLHLASEGEDSEVTPCCGNLGELRDLLRALTCCQSGDDAGVQLYFGREILQTLEGDGDGHGLGSRDSFPLLHRVLDGIRAQQANRNSLPSHTGPDLSDWHSPEDAIYDEDAAEAAFEAKAERDDRDGLIYGQEGA